MKKKIKYKISADNNHYEITTKRRLYNNLNDNLNIIKDILSDCDDLIIREFTINNKKSTKAAVIFINEIISKQTINESILKPLINGHYKTKNDLEIDNIDIISNSILTAGIINKLTTIEDIIDECLAGNTILLVDGLIESLVINTKEATQRNIEEPQTEVVVRGPREGFCENALTNISLLRQKIKNPNFKIKSIILGQKTNTKIFYCYLKELADTALIEEVEKRLNKIKIDAILESGYIEQLIEDAPYSIFSTVANSEKPDAVASKLLEGKVGIIVDGTPFVLTVPMTFNESFESSEDYYSRPYYASIVRILRFVSFSISILAPAVYVALTSFHQELLPTPLLITMAASHEGVPFPSVIEAFLMVFAFEIIKEAGVRLPRPVGSAISIVGALVIGEAAVTAGLVGAPMIIVIAITAISSFIIPSQGDAIAILRYIYIFLAGVMGAFGIVIGLIQLLIHLSSLRSFGVPYLYPLAPVNLTDLKKVIIRPPIWQLNTRPGYLNVQDKKRQSNNQKPTPPTNNS